MHCHFYILYSRRIDKYYLGHTCDDLEKRLHKHNTHHKGFTGRARDWIIVYRESYLEKSQAYYRERTVKSWKSRQRIEELIKKN